MLAPGGMSPKTVLLAVDDALIRWALEKDLSARGVEVHGVESAAATLERVRGNDYGLIFLDVDLPDARGLTLLDSMHESSPRTKIVVLGCDVDPVVKRDAFDRGAWQFVDKPFDLRDVVGLVRSVFGAYSENRSHRRYLCRMPLRVSLLGPSSDSPVELENLSCSTVDVGPGGMRLLTNYRLRVGQRLRAGVLRPGEPCAVHVPLRGEAEVVWSGRTESGFTGGMRWLSGPTPDRTS